MPPVVRATVYNSDEAFGSSLRAALLGCEGLKIVAEVDEPVVLPQAVGQFPSDILVAHLDPAPEAVLPILGEVAAGHPDLAIFAVSASSDGQLILSAMRHGIREFLTKPIDQNALAEAIGRVMQRSAGKQSAGTLVTVIGGAGGVGATTLAVNLAVELKGMTAGDVTVVDLDHRFGQVATLLDLEPTYTMADLCESQEQLEPQMIERALLRHSSGIQVLSRPLQFAQADGITAAHCVGVLTALTATNEYVVVDGPTRFDFGAKAVLDIADHNLLLMQLLVPTVRNAHRMLEGLTEVGFNLDRVKLVCNRVGGEGGGITVEDVAATLNREVFGQIPDDCAAVGAAINVGEPLATSVPKSKARQAIKALAGRLHAPGGAAEEVAEDGKKKGLLRKIF